MKNIKTILTIVSLLAAPVAFGCSQCEKSMAMDSDDGDEAVMSSPRSMNNSMNSSKNMNRMNSQTNRSASGMDTMHSPTSRSGSGMSSGVNSSRMMNQGAPRVAPAKMAEVDRPATSLMNLDDSMGTTDADYGYDNDGDFEIDILGQSATGYGSGASYSGY